MWYATEEDVMWLPGITYTARLRRQIGSKIEAASRDIDKQLRRRLYPETRSVAFDWPNRSYVPSYRLYLGSNELISVDSVVTGGVTLSASEYILRNGDDIDEPPYQWLDINRSTDASFSVDDTSQQSIVITGLFGYKDTSTAIPSAAVATGVNNSITTLVVKPSSGILDLGVGSLLLCGTERLRVTKRASVSTGVVTTNALTDTQADVSIGVASGAAFAIDEVLIIDSERMRIVDIVGNTLVVDRAFDGTVLDTHLLGATIYALRSLTVERGVLGSTAAAHLADASIYTHEYPAIARELCIAEAVVGLEQQASAYARTVSVGPTTRESVGKGLEDLRARAFATVGRITSRIGAI